MNKIPKVKFGLIGGSGTWGARFPEDFDIPQVKLLDVIPYFKTPFGKSAPFKLIEIAGERVLRVATHGATLDAKGIPLPIWISAQQVAWVFSKAGVEQALTDGSVGGIKNPEHPSEPLHPWSVVISDDYIMNSMDPIRPYTPNKPKVRMREPFCRFLQNCLYNAAVKEKIFKVYTRGIYVCTTAYRYETEAEIRMMSDWGANIVGETLGFEAPLMRNYGIHFASISIVANVAEGHVTWIGGSMKCMADFYRKCAKPVGRTIINAMKEIIAKKTGNCYCEMYHLTGLEYFPIKGA